jgi:hypothetical protein
LTLKRLPPALFLRKRVCDVNTIPNIRPFNEIYYKDCLYNSVIPIIDHFSGSRYPVFSNDILYYQLLDNTDPSSLQIIYQDADSLDQVLERTGLMVRTIDRCEQLIDNIAYSIKAGCPVVIWVDCYYESIRRDTYNKIHWGHTLLLYGIDLENRQCAIIEHQNRMNLNYRPHTVGFDDILRPYQGYLEVFYQAKFPTFFAFSKSTGGPHPVPERWRRMERERLIRHLDAYRPFIQQGLDDLRRAVNLTYDWYMAAGQQEIAVWIESLNKILNGKQMEHYRCKTLEVGAEILQLQENSLDLLKKLRAVIVRAYYSGNKLSNGLALSSLRDFYELEQRTYQKLCAVTPAAGVR